ncbi:hypothetical protein AtEden1_Chr3g0196641 [Arabidopsis thaliana]
MFSTRLLHGVLSQGASASCHVDARACLKIHNNNLKLLHVASYYVHSIEVSAPLLDIFSIDYIFDREYNFFIKSSRLFFTKNYGAIDPERVPIMNYNISYNVRMENLGHRFLMSSDANHLGRLKSLAVAVDIMNTKELEMFRQILVAWNGIMKKLDICFKMFNFSGLNKKQFALASRFITQGTVMNTMMIETSLIPPVEKFYIEAAVAKLMELPKGNKNLSIGYF